MTARRAVVAICLTEPRGGSDASNLQLRARRDGDDYVINGEKTSITFADRADAYLVFARTGGRTRAPRACSAFFIPCRRTWASRARASTTSAARIIGRGSVFFDDVRVPASHRLGDEGKGFTQVMQGFDYSRALIGAAVLSAPRRPRSTRRGRTRRSGEAFGRPIGQFQGVSFPLAEGESQIAAVRQLCYHALALRDAGLPHTAEAAMVKWMGPRRRLRRDPSVPADLRPLRLEQGPAAPAAHARRDGPRDRRRHGRRDEADHCARAHRPRGGPVLRRRSTRMPYQSVFRAGLFAGQTIIVTGGGSGIGRCTAHELASLGAHVALVGRTAEKLERCSAEIAEDGGSASAHRLRHPRRGRGRRDHRRGARRARPHRRPRQQRRRPVPRGDEDDLDQGLRGRACATT